MRSSPQNSIGGTRSNEAYLTINCAPIDKPDAIIASLSLSHFVRGRPWAHIDMCGAARAATANSLLVPGCSGWGARPLARLALSFTPPD